MTNRPDRRALLAGLAAAPALTGAAAADPEIAVRQALAAFLTAFENCDLASMEQAFAVDAACFDRTTMSKAGTPGLTLEAFRRAPGMPAGMRQIALTFPGTRPGPPYHSVKPEDLLVTATSDMAVCSFHLMSPHVLGRRTVVMVRRDGAWKILHIHASNVDDSGA